VTRPSDAGPYALAQARGVTELLHYTTNRGLYGTIASQAVLSRAQLDEDEYLEHIRNPVWPRKDAPWIDHISLSVTSTNDDLFRRSRRHFRDLWWAVFSIDPSIIDDQGVVFTTTNNIYPAVLRGAGSVGFEAMFADEVVGRFGVIQNRAGLPANQPTDWAAEVLYPQRVSTDRLLSVYVGDAEHRRAVLAWCEALDHPDVDVQIRPDVFA
jgi:hypothetical protein